MEQLKQNLWKMDNDQFQREQQRNLSNLKRMYLKLHKLQITESQIDKELAFYRQYFDQDKQQLANQVLFREEINSLIYVLEELERENIDLEIKCLSAHPSDQTPQIQNIIDEFQDKKENEQNKYKKNSLYTKKEFSKSNNEEMEKLQMEIQTFKKKIEEEKSRIQELEKDDQRYLEDLSLLERLIKDEKKKNVDENQ